MKDKKKGFTLIEIIVVAAILVILAAIALPNLLRPRVNANETTAISSLRVISSACEIFRASNNSYPADLVALSGAIPAYIDSVLGSGQKQGYNFTYAFLNANQFTCVAAPVTANITGTRTFFVDESGLIRLNDANGAPI
jgi:type IV pilus assembly protein PilA